MFVVYVVVVAVTALLNAVSAGLDFAGFRQVRDNAEANGVPLGWLPMLGALKGAGAVGPLVLHVRARACTTTAPTKNTTRPAAASPPTTGTPTSPASSPTPSTR